MRRPTLPEGRLQLSSAVSTRFLSAEKILKMLQGGKEDKHWTLITAITTHCGFKAKVVI